MQSEAAEPTNRDKISISTANGKPSARWLRSLHAFVPATIDTVNQLSSAGRWKSVGVGFWGCIAVMVIDNGSINKACPGFLPTPGVNGTHFLNAANMSAETPLPGMYAQSGRTCS